MEKIIDLDSDEIWEFEEILYHLSVEQLEEIILETRYHTEEKKIAALNVRKRKIDHKFEWTDSNKNKLLELNTNIINCINNIKPEAIKLLNSLNQRISDENDSLIGFNMEIKFFPSLHDYDDETYESHIEDELIYFYNENFGNAMIKKTKDIEDMLLDNDNLSWNICRCFKDNFKNDKISYWIYQILEHQIGWSIQDLINIDKIETIINIEYEYL